MYSHIFCICFVEYPHNITHKCVCQHIFGKICVDFHNSLCYCVFKGGVLYE
uniref:Uncharacterized protein n=1 Tax=Caudovirales sp. ctCpR1 TaxID=2825760 RepID=A0A8S5V982_9CAUD|nr:MAG TPA: hypothetical protein [Caudovirales sp. ctCpR1]